MEIILPIFGFKVSLHLNLTVIMSLLLEWREKPALISIVILTILYHDINFFHLFLHFAMIACEGLLLLCSSCMCAVFGACQLSPHVWKTCCQNANGSWSSQWWTSHTQICFHVAEELLYNLNYNSLPLRRCWWLQSHSRMNKRALRYWS